MTATANELPTGTRFYLWGEHYEVTGHETVDGATPAVWVDRVSRGREKRLRVPIKVRAVLKHGSIRTATETEKHA